jgi:hypothetical protein
MILDRHMLADSAVALCSPGDVGLLAAVGDRREDQ